MHLPRVVPGHGGRRHQDGQPEGRPHGDGHAVQIRLPDAIQSAALLPAAYHQANILARSAMKILA